MLFNLLLNYVMAKVNLVDLNSEREFRHIRKLLDEKTRECDLLVKATIERESKIRDLKTRISYLEREYYQIANEFNVQKAICQATHYQVYGLPRLVSRGIFRIFSDRKTLD